MAQEQPKVLPDAPKKAPDTYVNGGQETPTNVVTAPQKVGHGVYQKVTETPDGVAVDDNLIVGRNLLADGKIVVNGAEDIVDTDGNQLIQGGTTVKKYWHHMICEMTTSGNLPKGTIHIDLISNDATPYTGNTYSEASTKIYDFFNTKYGTSSFAIAGTLVVAGRLIFCDSMYCSDNKIYINTHYVNITDTSTMYVQTTTYNWNKVQAFNCADKVEEI